MSRRPSSTLVRKWCYEFWATAAGKLICYLCGRILDPERDDWEAEHEIARGLGGSDRPPNVKPCCAGQCPPSGALDAVPVGHKIKTKDDKKRISKTARITAKRLQFKRTKNPMPGSKGSGWAKKFNRVTGRWEAVRRER